MSNIAIQKAQNPQTVHEELAKLSQNLDPKVRQNVAKNLNTASQTLSNMVNDPCEEVLVELAKNIKLSQYSLEKLIGNENKNISTTSKLTYNSMFTNISESQIKTKLKGIKYLESRAILSAKDRRLLNSLQNEVKNWKN